MNTKTKDVVIVSACRTAIGRFGGTLKDSNGPDNCQCCYERSRAARRH